MSADEFDWTEYQKLADIMVELELSISCEARYRAAVSRYYYASFHCAKQYANKHYGLKITGKSEDHERVTDNLVQNAHEDFVSLSAQQLRKLRRYRNMCDYAGIVDNIEKILKASRESSEKIISNLKEK